MGVVCVCAYAGVNVRRRRHVLHLFSSPAHALEAPGTHPHTLTHTTHTRTRTVYTRTRTYTPAHTDARTRTTARKHTRMHTRTRTCSKAAGVAGGGGRAELGLARSVVKVAVELARLGERAAPALAAARDVALGTLLAILVAGAGNLLM